MNSLENTYLTFIKSVHKVQPPRYLKKYFGRLVLNQSKRWLELRGIDENDVISASWTILIVSSALILSISVPLFFLIGSMRMIPILLASFLFPVVLASLILNVPNWFITREERMLFRDSPAVIGCMSMSIQFDPSIEHAIIFTSKHIEGPLSEKLFSALWGVVTRSRTNAVSGLLQIASSLSNMNDGLRQALHLIISSTCEKTKDGISRVLDKANSIVISGIKEGVEKYVVSLTVPTLVLFALGVLLPVMILSFFPLLIFQSYFSMASSDGINGITPSMEPTSAYVLLLIILPAMTFLFANSILSRNPMNDQQKSRIELGRYELSVLAFVVATTFVFLLSGLAEDQPYVVLLMLSIPVPILFALKLRSDHLSRNRNRENEKEFITALYQMGNRMIAGGSFEISLKECTESRFGSPFADFAKRVIHKSRMMRKNIEHVVVEEIVILSISPLIKGAMQIVARCANRDTQGAGRLAVNLAQHLSDLKSCELKIEERLRGVVDMMRSTCIFFAPVVLGMTCSIFSVVNVYGSIATPVLNSNILVAGIYLIELTFIITYFTVFLLGDRSWNEVLFQFGRRMPLSMVVFIGTSLLTQMWLIRFL
ncbi:MAG: hypothetical protein H5T41_02155 [Methanomassiliicoccales archaeon]|nr:hypothetical protein [Methanomassiliicoccales archaeon]